MAFGQQFRPRQENGLKWPVATVFVAESRRLLYCPIAKCGCSSLKRLMVELSDLPLKEEILATNVHATGMFRTGALLRDQEIDRARQIIQDPAFFRFAVVRDPFERLVSGYREKFLINRLRPSNHWHTSEVIAAVQGRSTPDFDMGISFAEFIHYVTSQDPKTLDPHWRPQTEYLRDMHYDRIYAIEDLGALSDDLTQMVGHQVNIEHYNRSAPTRGIEIRGITRKRSGEIETPEIISTSSFSETPELLSLVAEYYAEDQQLHRDALPGASRCPPTC